MPRRYPTRSTQCGLESRQVSPDRSTTRSTRCASPSPCTAESRWRSTSTVSLRSCSGWSARRLRTPTECSRGRLTTSFRARGRLPRDRRRRRETLADGSRVTSVPGPLPTTRFVVDIITGTSAGGINGILLAKALANGLDDIDALKQLWIKEGQLDDLLNEPAAYDAVERYKYEEPPTVLTRRRSPTRSRPKGHRRDGRPS